MSTYPIPNYSQAAIRYITQPTEAEAARTIHCMPYPKPEALLCQPFLHGKRYDSRITLNGRAYHLGMHSDLAVAQRTVMAAQWRLAQVIYCLPDWQEISDKPLVTNTFLVDDRGRLPVGTAEEFLVAMPSIRSQLQKLEETMNPRLPGSPDDRRRGERRRKLRRMRDQEKEYSD